MEIKVKAVHDKLQPLPEQSTADDVLNILVSLPFLIEKMDEALDTDGKRNKSYFDILKALLEGINTALGGINDFDFAYDDDLNQYFLIDRNATPVSSANYPVFTLAGLDSIFTEIGISSKISNEMGAQISIAAQGSSMNYSENVDNILKWNPGIIDRVRPTKDISTKPSPVLPKTPEELEKEEEENQRILDWFENVETFYDDFNGEYDGFDREDLEAAKTMHGEWTANNVVIKKSQLEGTPIPGTIPVELSFKMDGIAGLKIGEAFRIGLGILPRDYQNKFGYIITGLEHSIDQKNKWETSVTTQFYLLEGGEPIAASPSPNNNNNNNNTNTPIAEKAGGTSRVMNGVKYKNGEIPDDKLRPILNQSKYKGDIASDGGRIRLYTDASLALDKLLAAADKESITFKINSAYRTYTDQQRVYKQNCSKGVCDPPTATPGTSNHGFGVAVDFANRNLTKLSTGMKEYKWLVLNAGRFGFKRIRSEVWHWEFQNV
jgi:LAS superfamily LD-carboxypeptidase LdcB